MNPERRARLYNRVDRATRVPMLVLAGAMVPLLLLPALAKLPPDVEDLFVVIDGFIWLAFAAELAAKTYLAPSRARYLRDNWLDVVIVAIPVFRPFRFLRFLRLAVFLARAAFGLRRLLVHHGLAYTLLAGLVAVAAAALAVSLLEQGAEGATIKDFPDGLWWAVTTISTVGYGDRFPVTGEGRVVAAALMLFGITFFGVLTASLAAFFVESRKDERIDEVLRRLEALEAKLNHRPPGE